PKVQLLIAAIRGEVVGYLWCRIVFDTVDVVSLFHREILVPEWRGKGIGTALLRHAESLLGAFAGTRPHGESFVFRSNVSASERESVERLQREGYTVENSMLELVLNDLSDLPEPVVPDDI